MKTLTLLSFFLLNTLLTYSQVASLVYDYDKPESIKNQKGLETRTFFKDESRDFSTMQMDAVIFRKAGKLKLENKGAEQLIIVKKGKINFTLNGKEQIMGAGSIALVMPGDLLRLTAPQESEVFVMTYTAKEGQSLTRGKESGGSFMMDWEEIAYKTHDKGGIRNFYNKPTAACKRMEMHVTNLNAGIKSHEPHTHRAAEIVLMIKGESEMELDGKIIHGNTGDIYYLGSEVPHAIKNIDSQQIQYFAYQFE